MAVIVIDFLYALYAGFHPEILVWGGRGVAISQTMFLSPLPRVFLGGGKGIAWFSVS